VNIIYEAITLQNRPNLYLQRPVISTVDHIVRTFSASSVCTGTLAYMYQVMTSSASDPGHSLFNPRRLPAHRKNLKPLEPADKAGGNREEKTG
jgi:hypothetical protein